MGLLRKMRVSIMQYLAYGKRIELEEGGLTMTKRYYQPVDAEHPIKVGPFNGSTFYEYYSPPYRSRPGHIPKIHFWEVSFGTMVWFFLFWNLWQRPRDIINHFHVPDPSTWTDEQLGVPAEDDPCWKEYLKKQKL
ncbi:hypothetical protein ACOME3_006925 [Neoechinorhynchus agilis]